MIRPEKVPHNRYLHMQASERKRSERRSSHAAVASDGQATKGEFKVSWFVLGNSKEFTTMSDDLESALALYQLVRASERSEGCYVRDMTTKRVRVHFDHNLARSRKFQLG